MPGMIRIRPIPGPPGPKGDTGQKGYRGYQGYQGSVIGVSGYQGYRGYQGYQGKSGSTEQTITQNNHNFSVGDIVRYEDDGLGGGEYILAKANTAENSEVAGIVKQVIDPNTFVLHIVGFITLGSNITSFLDGGDPVPVSGDALWLSINTFGGLTSSDPSGTHEINKPLFIVVDPSVGSGYFYNWRGVQNSDLQGGWVDEGDWLSLANPADRVSIATAPGIPPLSAVKLAVKGDIGPQLINQGNREFNLGTPGFQWGNAYLGYQGLHLGGANVAFENGMIVSRHNGHTLRMETSTSYIGTVSGTGTFAIGDVVGFGDIGSGAQWYKALAVPTSQSNVIGVVQSIQDDAGAGEQTFNVITWGYIDNLSGLTPGTIYYLSPSTPGAYDANPILAAGTTIDKVVFTAISETSAIVQGTRGFQVQYGLEDSGWEYVDVDSPADGIKDVIRTVPSAISNNIPVAINDINAFSGFTLGVKGNVGPQVDDTYDLGALTKRWKDIYLGPASIYLGQPANDIKISHVGTTTLEIDHISGSDQELLHIHKDGYAGLFTPPQSTTNKYALTIGVNEASHSGSNSTALDIRRAFAISSAESTVKRGITNSMIVSFTDTYTGIMKGMTTGVVLKPQVAGGGSAIGSITNEDITGGDINAYVRSQGTAASDLVDGNTIDTVVRGIKSIIGHRNDQAGGPAPTITTDTVEGLKIESNAGFGTIDNLKAIYLTELQSGATFTNTKYALYSDIPNAHALVDGSVLPLDSTSGDLGSTTQRWGSLYVTGASIYMGAGAGDQATMSFSADVLSIDIDANQDIFSISGANASDTKTVAIDAGHTASSDGVGLFVDRDENITPPIHDGSTIYAGIRSNVANNNKDNVYGIFSDVYAQDSPHAYGIVSRLDASYTVSSVQEYFSGKFSLNYSASGTGINNKIGGLYSEVNIETTGADNPVVQYLFGTYNKIASFTKTGNGLTNIESVVGTYSTFDIQDAIVDTVSGSTVEITNNDSHDLTRYYGHVVYVNSKETNLNKVINTSGQDASYFISGDTVRNQQIVGFAFGHAGRTTGDITSYVGFKTITAPYSAQYAVSLMTDDDFPVSWADADKETFAALQYFNGYNLSMEVAMQKKNAGETTGETTSSYQPGYIKSLQLTMSVTNRYEASDGYLDEINHAHLRGGTIKYDTYPDGVTPAPAANGTLGLLRMMRITPSTMSGSAGIGTIVGTSIDSFELGGVIGEGIYSGNLPEYFTGFRMTSASGADQTPLGGVPVNIASRGVRGIDLGFFGGRLETSVGGDNGYPFTTGARISNLTANRVDTGPDSWAETTPITSKPVPLPDSGGGIRGLYVSELTSGDHAGTVKGIQVYNLSSLSGSSVTGTLISNILSTTGSSGWGAGNAMGVNISSVQTIGAGDAFPDHRAFGIYINEIETQVATRGSSGFGDAYGIDINNVTAGIGVGTVVGNAFGLRITSVVSNGDAYDAYGIRIDDVEANGDGSTAYAIHSSSTSAASYFESQTIGVSFVPSTDGRVGSAIYDVIPAEGVWVYHIDSPGWWAGSTSGDGTPGIISHILPKYKVDADGKATAIPLLYGSTYGEKLAAMQSKYWKRGTGIMQIELHSTNALTLKTIVNINSTDNLGAIKSPDGSGDDVVYDSSVVMLRLFNTHVAGQTVFYWKVMFHPS